MHPFAFHSPSHVGVTWGFTFAADMAKQNTTGQLPRPKVQLSFTLDASGIASLSKAEVSVVEEYEVDAPPPKAEPKAEDNATAENATEANATDADAAEAAKDEEKPAEAGEALVSEEEDISSRVSSSRALVLMG